MEWRCRLGHAPVGFVIGATRGFGPPSPRVGPPQQLGVPRFDSKGADFAAWLERFRVEVYGGWVVPEIVKRAYAQLEFVVERTGRVSSAKVIDPSGIPAFDEGARNAILGAKLLPLPDAYHQSRVKMRIVFFYH
jgi:TonB family protein